MRIYRCLTVLGLIVSLGAASALPAAASEIEEAEEEVAATQEELDSLRSSIDDLESQKEKLTGEIDDLQTKLVTTISAIDSLNRQIDDMILQLEVTTIELENAVEDRDVQYAAMKKRIQYLYETGGEAGWASVFLAGGNISDILDKAQYTQQMYDYDRNQLEEYLDSIERVEALQSRQLEEKVSLETRKREQEEAQTRLEELLAQAKDEYEDFDEQIAAAYEKAEEYQALIDAQNEAIAQLIAAQEAMGVGYDEAAEVAQYIVDAYVASGGDITSMEGSDEVYSSSGLGGAGVGTTAYSGSAQFAQSANTSANGQAILAFAQQFLGNRYVYGGNSLTSGVDCSGFVQQVYRNFGINTSRTSWDIESDGQAVSYNDVQVGDVICYGGHVGIYAGDGKIINAIDEEHGIGYSNANYAEIRSIRRFVSEDAPAAPEPEAPAEAPVEQAPVETAPAEQTDTASSTPEETGEVVAVEEAG